MQLDTITKLLNLPNYKETYYIVNESKVRMISL